MSHCQGTTRYSHDKRGLVSQTQNQHHPKVQGTIEGIKIYRPRSGRVQRDCRLGQPPCDARAYKWLVASVTKSDGGFECTKEKQGLSKHCQGDMMS